jgi:hypothetical protein
MLGPKLPEFKKKELELAATSKRNIVLEIQKICDERARKMTRLLIERKASSGPDAHHAMIVFASKLEEASELSQKIQEFLDHMPDTGDA